MAILDGSLENALFEEINNRKASVEKIKSLIEAGANVNVKDDNGDTPLHCCRDANIAKVLIDAGTDVNAINKHGDTPLHYCGDANIAKVLIDAGIDVNVKNDNGDTPLHCCIDANIAKVLIDAGTDVNAINKWGNSPLFSIRFIRGFDHSDVSEIVDILIDAGADLTLFNLTNDFGDLNVHIGAYNCTPKIMKVLISAGASEYFDSDKDNTCAEYSPLHGCNNLEVAKMLVENDIDVNAVTMNWETPLDTIANKDVIKYLKKNGAVYGEELEDEDDDEF